MCLFLSDHFYSFHLLNNILYWSDSLCFNVFFSFFMMRERLTLKTPKFATHLQKFFLQMYNIYIYMRASLSSKISSFQLLSWILEKCTLYPCLVSGHKPDKFYLFVYFFNSKLLLHWYFFIFLIFNTITKQISYTIFKHGASKNFHLISEVQNVLLK